MSFWDGLHPDYFFPVKTLEMDVYIPITKDQKFLTEKYVKSASLGEKHITCVQMIE